LTAKVLNTQVFTIFVVMALVNTFITTPAVHFLYIRPSKLNKKRMSKAEYLVALGVQNKDSLSSLINVSALFSKAKDNFYLKALLLQEISDRPSSYFFSEFAGVLQTAPIIKGKTTGGLLISKAKQTGQIQDLDVHAKLLYGSDLPSDLVDYVNEKNCDVLILEFIPPHIENPKVNLRKSDMRRSAAEIVDKSIGTVESVISNESSLVLARSAINKVDCEVALLIMSEELRIKFQDNPKPIQKVLFIYSGTPAEQSALNTVLKSPPHVEVTILLKDPASISGKELRENISLVQTENLENLALEEIPRGNPDLLVFGKPRNLTEAMADPLLRTNVPSLVIFPPTRLPITMSDPEELTESTPMTSGQLVNLPTNV